VLVLVGRSDGPSDTTGAKKIHPCANWETRTAARQAPFKQARFFARERPKLTRDLPGILLYIMG
jgi:hypothetical protein